MVKLWTVVQASTTDRRYPIDGDDEKVIPGLSTFRSSSPYPPVSLALNLDPISLQLVLDDIVLRHVLASLVAILLVRNQREEASYGDTWMLEEAAKMVQKRGVNDRGRVANEVETEAVVS
ncbi:hypothetical protein K1719_044001 [Acacia pycnantha]|nr:hypothetical protein K1719_044001 [Acacia pycnantha]